MVADDMSITIDLLAVTFLSTLEVSRGSNLNPLLSNDLLAFIYDVKLYHKICTKDEWIILQSNLHNLG